MFPVGTKVKMVNCEFNIHNGKIGIIASLINGNGKFKYCVDFEDERIGRSYPCTENEIVFASNPLNRR